MKSTKIFVYGTLMSGFRNHKNHFYDSIVSIKSAYVFGRLFHMHEKNCPILVDGGDKVHGQIIEFMDDDKRTILRSMDELEEYFEGSAHISYVRKRVEAHVVAKNKSIDCETVDAYAYDGAAHRDAAKALYLPDGDWQKYAIANGIV